MDISFQSAGTGKYAIPTRHLNFHFAPLVVTFPMVKSKTIGFLLDLTQQYTPVLFAKTPRELPLEKELLSGHYVVYSEVGAHDSTMNTLKNAGSAWQNDV